MQKRSGLRRFDKVMLEGACSTNCFLKQNLILIISQYQGHFRFLKKLN